MTKFIPVSEIYLVTLCCAPKSDFYFNISAQAPIHLPFEDLAVHADHKVLMEVNDTSAPNVADPHGLFGQYLMPHLIQPLNTSITF